MSRGRDARTRTDGLRGPLTAPAAPGAASGTSAPTPGNVAPGPLVGVCTGHRCAGLRRLAGGQVLDEGLSAAVRATRGAVMISCPCLGRCEQGPLTVVGHHGAVAAPAGPHEGEGACGPPRPAAPTVMVWLREVAEPAWRQALHAWVSGGVTQQVRGAFDSPDAPSTLAVRVPGALRGAVVGYSNGSAIQRLPDPPSRGAGR